jgi:CDP-diacylglycerol--glycerol-3-phosphate 3-phosphatidyltransferase
MDPLADKFLVVSCVIMLQELHRIHPVVVMLLICRELAITALRALASAEGVIIDASRGAKWKTATQMLAIPLMMIKPGIFGIPLFAIGEVLLYVSLGISLWSAVDYMIDFFRALREKRRAKKKARQERAYSSES